MIPDTSHMPQQTTLSIDFVIVGGGVAGLACAVALRRVGHRVVVLDADSSVVCKPSGGCRMTPNLSKILYHWGLQKELAAMGLKSGAIDLNIYETGEILGTHIWNEEMLKEARGEFIFAHYSDLRVLLYNVALAKGAKIRLNSKVSSIDPFSRTVTLASGEVIYASVIVGADGTSGLSRRLLVDEDTHSVKMNMYSTTVPKDAMLKDEELSYFYTRKFTSMFSWFGNGRALIAFPVGGTPEFAMSIYVPYDRSETSWKKEVSLTTMQKVLEPCESRIRKLARLAAPPVCLPVPEYPELEEWVHESGRLVLVGEAAHPLPPGAIQNCAMAVEDGAVLAKLFSHLRTDDQINSFLWAFQDIRQPRLSKVRAKEFNDIHFMSFPPGENQTLRDSTMRAKRDAGINILDASDDSEETLEWVEMKELFGYDAEDEADNWWIKWGILKERAKGTELRCGIFDEMTIRQEEFSEPCLFSLHGTGESDDESDGYS